MQTGRRVLGALAGAAVLIGSGAFVSVSAADATQDKYSLKVPGGLAFAEFRGFETWEVVSVSDNGRVMAVILGNPAMIAAYKSGIPANGKPVPDGAKMAKIHWIPKKSEFFPDASIPGVQRDVDFMVKDSKRFGNDGGWGYAVFAYDAASSTFRPGTTADSPPQGNDAKCGVACHTIVKNRDYVFTEYGHR
ncbi:MAG: cytochrome P460 family protein [Caldimonas sp.]